MILMKDKNIGEDLVRIWSRDIVIGPSIIHVKNFQIGARATNLVSLDSASSTDKFQVRDYRSRVKG